MDAPVLRCYQSQQQLDRLHARYRRKDFLEVDALALDEAAGDEPSLVLDNGAALVPLHLVDLLQPDRPAAHR